MEGIVISCPIISDGLIGRRFQPDTTIERLVLPEIPLTLTLYNDQIIVHGENYLKLDDSSSPFAPTVIKTVEVPDDLIDLAREQLDALNKFREEEKARQQQLTASFINLKEAAF